MFNKPPTLNKGTNRFLWRASVGLFLWFCYACKNENSCENDIDTTGINIQTQIIRFDQELKKANGKAEVENLLKLNPLFANNFLLAGQIHPDTAINNLLALKTDKHIDTMFADCQHTFADFSAIGNQIASAFKHTAYYYPNWKAPKVYTIVSGFGSDLYVSDSLVVIALESFLGDSGHYKPAMTPQYILQRMKPDFLVPSVVMMQSSKFNKVDILDNTLIAEMIQWGKTYYYMKRIMPCTPDSIIIGYSAKQWAGSETNLAKIYAYFVERKLFFEPNHIEINRYIGERPKTLEVGNECPGRIGRYLGWKIVDKYMKTKKVSLQELMQEKNARKIFAESKFRPDA